MFLGVQNYQAVIEVAERFEQEFSRQTALGHRPYFIPHPQLGWISAANAQHKQLQYRTDDQGYRRSAEKRNDAAPVLAFYGDSYVHGDEVADQETWLWQLQERVASRWSVRNAGVSGYGTDQALLRFSADIPTRKPHTAILAVTTTDLYRNLNVCRSFIAHKGDFPFLKPRYIIQGGKAILVSPPVMSFDTIAAVMRRDSTRRHLQQYDMYYPTKRRLIMALAERIGFAKSEDQRLLPEAIAVCSGILAEFAALCATHTVKGIVLLLPAFWGRYPAGEEFDALQANAGGLGLPVIDGRRAFVDKLAQPKSILHHQKNHYTATSGGWVSELVAQEIPAI